MELTNEIKCKVFGLYIGCGVKNSVLSLNKTYLYGATQFSVITSGYGYELSPCLNVAYIIDYLRSKGYALPYLGLDLFTCAALQWVANQINSRWSQSDLCK